MTSPYERLGLRPIINASGSVTRLGGARMPDAVLAAFLDAARDTVPLEQLQAAASRRLAEVTGAEAGLVTAGSAASLELGAAAILAGLDPALMERLPDTARGMKCEFIVAREQRNGYDHAVRRRCGGSWRSASTRSSETPGCAAPSFGSTPRPSARDGGNPVQPLANESPSAPGVGRPRAPKRPQGARRRGGRVATPVEPAGHCCDRGGSRRFSGGKAIRGPQSTGILCGRRDLIASAALQMLDNDDHPELWDPPKDFIDRSRLAGLPRHGLGRSLKVSKEEIVALLTSAGIVLRRQLRRRPPTIPLVVGGDRGGSGRYGSGLSDDRIPTRAIAPASGNRPVPHGGRPPDRRVSPPAAPCVRETRPFTSATANSTTACW